MYIQGIRYGYVESLHHKDILWRGQYCCLGYLSQLCVTFRFRDRLMTSSVLIRIQLVHCHRIGLRKSTCGCINYITSALSVNSDRQIEIFINKSIIPSKGKIRLIVPYQLIIVDVNSAVFIIIFKY